jgi:hypothetical protein
MSQWSNSRISFVLGPISRPENWIIKFWVKFGPLVGRGPRNNQALLYEPYWGRQSRFPVIRTGFSNSTASHNAAHQVWDSDPRVKWPIHTRICPSLHDRSQCVWPCVRSGTTVSVRLAVCLNFATSHGTDRTYATVYDAGSIMLADILLLERSSSIFTRSVIKTTSRWNCPPLCCR